MALGQGNRELRGGGQAENLIIAASQSNTALDVPFPNREPSVPMWTLRHMRATDFAALRERCQILIEQHYRDPRVGPTWLARELFVSRRQLDRAFLEHPSITELLAKRRLRQVVAVAAMHPAAPMSEIARRCGYGTYETFRAQCHRYLRCSPREARGLRMSALAPAAAA